MRKIVIALFLFSFGMVNIIFEEGIDFYWARTRILERLNLAQKDLPEGVIPQLGPDATALGQIFWYTVEGQGFSLHQLVGVGLLIFGVGLALGLRPIFVALKSLPRFFYAFRT